MLWTFLAVLAVYFYWRWTKWSSYWKDRGVKYLEPLPIVGNSLPLLRGSIAVAHLIQNFYNNFPKERYIGIFQFTQPVLLVRDPKLIKEMTIKSFEHFTDHEVQVPVEVDPLWGNNLVSSQGAKWRNLRQTLSPVFTSSKIKSMFKLMADNAKQFIDYFLMEKKDVIEVEIKDAFHRYTNDTIVSIAFGANCNSMTQPNNEFMKAGRDVSDFSGLKGLRFILYGKIPRIVKWLNLKIISTETGNFFKSVIKEAITMREEKNIVRPDLIHLLMEARKGKLKNDDQQDVVQESFATVQESQLESPNETRADFLTNDVITAQSIVFFLAGFESISSTLSLLCQELVENPEIQSKLRREVLEVAENFGNDVTYEALQSMKYLDMVVCETLRKWPQAVFMDRICTKEFTIEPEQPGEKALTLKVGDVVWFPVYGIQRDPQYYSNPDTFDPERFSEENKSKICDTTFISFGNGPRNCIGSRFALIETKTMIYYLLKHFEIVPVAETQIPLVLRKDALAFIGEKGFPLGLKRLCN